MGTITKDDLWKVFSLLMSALVLPLAGWVWNTNVKVAELQNDLGDAEDVIGVLVAKKDQKFSFGVKYTLSIHCPVYEKYYFDILKPNLIICLNF